MIRMANEEKYIKNYDLHIKETIRKIDDLNESLANLREYLAAAQKVCDHEMIDYPEGFCHHKREEFMVCKKCGMIK